jgi:hypothetical protein
LCGGGVELRAFSHENPCSKRWRPSNSLEMGSTYEIWLMSSILDLWVVFEAWINVLKLYFHQ